MLNIETEDVLCKVSGILNNVMDAHADRQHEHLVAALWAADGLIKAELKRMEGNYEARSYDYKAEEANRKLAEVLSDDYEMPDYAALYASDETGDEETDTREDTEDGTRFNVELLKENEDGSAVFQVSGSDDSMKQLFEAFFCQAVINGILMTEKGTARYSAQQRVIDAARDLEVLLEAWETNEDFDYDPVVKNARRELAEALRKVSV